MIETVVMVAIVSIIMAAMSVWAVGAMAAQSQTRANNADTATISLINTNVLRDVTSAQFAVGSFNPSDGNPRPAGQLVDCVGGDGAGDVQLVLVTPGDRRIVYTLVDPASGSSDRGKVLYRRDCANTHAALGVTAGDPSILDPSLTDVAPGGDEEFLNSPVGDDATEPTTSRKITDNVREFNTSCPMVPRQNTSDPNEQDVNCRTVKMTVLLGDEDRAPVNFQATRRTDTYCAPGCPPDAWFTFSPSNPAKFQTVQFDASPSIDRRSSRPSSSMPPRRSIGVAGTSAPTRSTSPTASTTPGSSTGYARSGAARSSAACPRHPRCPGPTSTTRPPSSTRPAARPAATRTSFD